MKKPYLNCFLFAAVFLMITTVGFKSAFSATASSIEPGWEDVDSVVALVNSSPIVESDLEERFNIVMQRKKVPKNKIAYEKSRVLDSYIEEMLLYQIAVDSSLLVSDEKVDNRIKNDIMPLAKVKTMDQFVKLIESQEKISFNIWKDELRKQILMELIMIYEVDFVPPTQKDAEEWYRQNKDKMPPEVNFQYILIKTKDDSYSSLKVADSKIEQIRSRLANGEAFGKLAREFSDDPFTAKTNGTTGWIALSMLDPMLAGYLYQLKDPAPLYTFKSPAGYYVIKFKGLRSTPFEDIKDKIMMMLSQKTRLDQFQSWIKMKRKYADVRIYMTGYLPEVEEKIKK